MQISQPAAFFALSSRGSASVKLSRQPSPAGSSSKRSSEVPQLKASSRGGSNSVTLPTAGSPISTNFGNRTSAPGANSPSIVSGNQAASSPGSVIARQTRSGG